MLGSIISNPTAGVSFSEMLICTIVSLALGLVIACIYMFRNTYSKHLVVTIVLLPALVQTVIMMVNGNLGTGVAVAGAFSLVRFRSAPGTAREITSIFFAMAIGLANGMGYIAYAAIFTGIISLALLLLTVLNFGERSELRRLRVTIPEDLDYSNIFDDLFLEYTKEADLEQVKTTNLGSLYELQYSIVIKDAAREKEFIDQIRCRNGNLNIVCGKLASKRDEL